MAVAGDRLELRLDGAAFATPKSVLLTDAHITAGYVDFTVLAADLGADGAKSLAAVISDRAGNAGAASTATAFTLDTAAPTAPSMELSSDTGTSSSDRITKVGTLNVTGLESGASVQYSTDGGSTWGTSFAAVEGANTVQVRQIGRAHV